MNSTRAIKCLRMPGLQQNDSALELIRQLRQAQPVEDARTD
jgi:hypothetical protein